VIAKTYKSHRAKEWIKFLEEIDKQVPQLAEPDHPGGEPHVLEIHVIAWQLRDAQDASCPGMAGQAPAVPCSFHAGPAPPG